MLRSIPRRVFGAAMRKQVTALGAAYLELARTNRIDNAAVVEFKAGDMWKASAGTHRRIRESIDSAAVALTESLARGDSLETAAARYAKAAAGRPDEYELRTRAVLRGLGGDAATVGLAVFDFWTQPIATAAERLAAIAPRVALTHAPVEAAACRWSASKPRFKADLAILDATPAVGAPEALAIADLLIGAARHSDVEPWLSAARPIDWTPRQAEARDRLIALSAAARDAGTDASTRRALAVFRDDDAPLRDVTVPVKRIDRTHNRFARHGGDTWLIASGPHLEPSAGGGFHFPYHSALTPLFVGWECHDVDVLTPDAVAYLRTHGPVGCADVLTQEILSAHGVPNFASGPRSHPTAVGAAALEVALAALESGASADEVAAAWRAAARAGDEAANT